VTTVILVAYTQQFKNCRVQFVELFKLSKVCFRTIVWTSIGPIVSVFESIRVRSLRI